MSNPKRLRVRQQGLAQVRQSARAWAGSRELAHWPYRGLDH